MQALSQLSYSPVTRWNSSGSDLPCQGISQTISRSESPWGRRPPETCSEASGGIREALWTVQGLAGRTRDREEESSSSHVFLAISQGRGRQMRRDRPAVPSRRSVCSPSRIGSPQNAKSRDRSCRTGHGSQGSGPSQAIARWRLPPRRHAGGRRGRWGPWWWSDRCS